jgi:hypothetical protein
VHIDQNLSHQSSFLRRVFAFEAIGNTLATEGDGPHVFTAYPEAKPSS